MAKADQGTNVVEAPRQPARGVPATERTGEALIGRQDGAARKWSTEKLDLFLGHLARTGNAALAAAEVDMPVAGAQALRSRNAVFRRLWTEAKAQYREQVEARLLARAVDGVVEVTERKSGPVVRTRYDTRLAVEALRVAVAAREVVYAEEVTTPEPAAAVATVPGQLGEGARLRLEAQLAEIAQRAAIDDEQ